MGRETYTHGHIADRIFEDQVPADNPGNQFPHGCVGVGVGAARDRNHGSEFRVTQSGKSADNRYQNQRQRESWARARAAYRSRMVYQEVEQRSVEDGRCIELLAGDGSSDHGEDA